jgi:hypothetical protein
MATAAQIQANRLNAQKSPGPRTTEGKERACHNAIKHGLLAREAVIQGEDPAEFEVYRDGMLEELAPAGPVEAMLAERVVGLSWRLLRAERLQNAAFAALEEGERTELLEARLEEWKQHRGNEQDRTAYGVLDENAALAKAVVEDFAEARVLDRMLMYERRIESSLYRTMAELRKEREARAAAELEKASHSRGNPPAGEESATTAELASFGANAVPEGVSSVEGAANAERRVSSDGCGRDTEADSRSSSPGGSGKWSPRSLPMASSQGQDHRQTSLPLPPRVEERLLSTSRALTPVSCETKPIGEEVPSLKC